MTPATPRPAWDTVMAQLTGLRLAIYDELLVTGYLDEASLTQAHTLDRTRDIATQIREAIAWLQSHRLVVGEAGQWRAIMPALARHNYETNGPINLPGTTRATPAAQPAAPAPVARGETAAVHRHQREFFTMEGYRDSLGSQQ